MNPAMDPGKPPLPITVRLASILLLVYGLAVLLSAVIVQQMSGWTDMQDLPRALLRFLGMGVIAWGLWRGAAWAWWAGVLLPSFFFLGGLVALYFLITSETGLAGSMAVYVVFSLMPLLGAAVVLLLLPDSRSAFKQAA